MADATAGSPLRNCPVCGGGQFTTKQILWPQLIAEWELTPAEAQYIDVQQGLTCATCGNNLRAMTLAAAILRSFGNRQTLQDLCRSDDQFRSLTVLEINLAGLLTPTLQLLPHHTLVEYPQFDMRRMNLADNSVDLIIHSDTLEHVPDAVGGLRECRRVLKARGHLFYTVPVVIGRLTKSRAGLPPSYHGAPVTAADDYRVQNEYGADFWCEIFEAGFQNMSLTSLIFPASVAIHAMK